MFRAEGAIDAEHLIVPPRVLRPDIYIQLLDIVPVDQQRGNQNESRGHQGFEERHFY